MSGHDLDSLTPPGAAVSAFAVDAHGRVLAERTPNRAVAPASNTKLVTSALALSELGPEFRFETCVYADERRPGEADGAGTPARAESDDRRLDGDLVVVGGGAPDLDVADLSTLADAVARQYDAVTGDVVVDAWRFAGPKDGPGRTVRDVEYAYGAPTTALSVGGNRVTVTVETDDAGVVLTAVDPASDAVESRFDVQVDPDADPDGEDVTVVVDQHEGDLEITGTLPPGVTYETQAPVRRPLVHAGSLLRSELASAGVEVEGCVEVADESAPRVGSPDESRPDSARARQVAAVQSAPLHHLVTEMNVHSDNVAADTLARSLAAHATGTGSWEAWRDLVTERFRALGVDIVDVRDGSGISRYNRLSARGVVALLRWAADSEWGPVLFDSLPEPGEGTLATRLDGVPVVAKTGTLTGVRALSGRIEPSENDRGDDDRPRDPVYFSLLVGDATVDVDSIRDRQDAVVASLAGL